MIRDLLPWDEIANIKEEDRTPIQCLIYNNEPANLKDAKQFRSEVLEALQESHRDIELPKLNQFQRWLEDNGIGQLHGNAPFIHKYLTTPKS